MNMDRWYSWMVGDRLDRLTDVHFEFALPFGNVMALLLLLAVAGGIFLYSWMRMNGVARPMRGGLAALRMAGIVLALWLCFDPCIVGEAVKQSEQTVAMLFDDTQSMQVHDDHGQTRGERLIAAYRESIDHLEKRLQNQYRIVKYRFGEGIEPLNDVGQLTFMQTSSDLVQALRSSTDELEGFPISAILLFSDGIQQTAAPALDLAQTSLPPVPVLTVGVEEDVSWQDLRIQKLAVNRTHFDQSPVRVHADVVATGLMGKQAQAILFQEGKIIQSKTFLIAEETQNTPLHFEWTPTQKGYLNYELQIHCLGGTSDESEQPIEIDARSLDREDRTPQNNRRAFLVDHTEKEYRILYYSSRPNWENRFIRRALQEDEQLHLSSLVLLSKADRKFVFRGAKSSLTNPLFDGFDNDEEKYGRYDEPIYLRLGLSETELVKGFPSQKEDLFAFQLLIIGDVEWEDFSADQLTLIRDFVEQRGGALLFLGGKDKFSSERFANSSLATLLPVLPPNASTLETTFIPDFFHVQPTTSGDVSGSWSLSTDPEENRKQWEEMPRLYGFDPFDLVRPGATVYANARSEHPQINRQLFFVWQRYGNGKCAMLAAGETWPWRMRTTEEMNAFERLWRQWIRDLVDRVPDPIQFLSPQDSYTVNQPATLRFHLRNPRFEDWENPHVAITLHTPAQRERRLEFEESLQESGMISSEWIPDQLGQHTLTVQISEEERPSHTSSPIPSPALVQAPSQTFSQSILVTPNENEFANARANPEFLREIADRTQGKFFTLDQLSIIPESIPRESRTNSDRQIIHLWYHPVFYLVLVLILGLEWYLRRTHGQP